MNTKIIKYVMHSDFHLKSYSVTVLKKKIVLELIPIRISLCFDEQAVLTLVVDISGQSMQSTEQESFDA